MNENKVIEILMDNTDRLEKIEGKIPKLDLLDTIVDTQDYIVKMLETMVSEQAANKSRSDRHENRIEHLEKDVQDLKIVNSIN